MSFLVMSKLMNLYESRMGINPCFSPVGKRWRNHSTIKLWLIDKILESHFTKRWKCYSFKPKDENDSYSNNTRSQPWMLWLSGLSTNLQPGHELESQPGHVPGLQARSLIGGVWEATSQITPEAITSSFQFSSEILFSHSFCCMISTIVRFIYLCYIITNKLSTRKK